MENSINNTYLEFEQIYGELGNPKNLIIRVSIQDVRPYVSKILENEKVVSSVIFFGYRIYDFNLLESENEKLVDYVFKCLLDWLYPRKRFYDSSFKVIKMNELVDIFVKNYKESEKPNVEERL